MAFEPRRGGTARTQRQRDSIPRGRRPRPRRPLRRSRPRPLRPPKRRSPCHRHAEQGPAETVSDYYALLPGDLDAAWPLMTADYQENHAGGRDAYNAFWAAIESVEIAEVSAPAPDQAQATLIYRYRDGSVVQEVTAYRLVEEGGVLKIAASEVHQQLVAVSGRCANSRRAPSFAGPKRVRHPFSCIDAAASGVFEGGKVSQDYRKTPEALSRLTPAQYRVTQEDGTEPRVPQRVLEQPRARHLRRRRLGPAAVLVDRQVRQRHRMAELHQAARGRRRHREGRPARSG